MRLTTLSVLCCALFTQSIFTAPIDMSTTPINLGIVNGEVNNDEIKIEKALNNPILLSVKQGDYEKPLKELVIKNAALTHQSDNELILTINSSLPDAMSMKSRVVLGLWVDGQRINLTGKQVRTEVKIPVPESYNELDLRVVKPISMTFPQRYRGAFKYSVEIEATTEE